MRFVLASLALFFVLAFVLVLNPAGVTTSVNADIHVSGDDDDDVADDDDHFDCKDPNGGDDGDDQPVDDPGPTSTAGPTDSPTPTSSFFDLAAPAGQPGQQEGGDHDTEEDDCVDRPSGFTAYGDCDGTTPGGYFYYETDYTGSCFRISADTSFFFADNDQASSLDLVGIGGIVICQHSDYNGYCITVTEDIPDLSMTSPPSNNDLSSAYFDGGNPAPTPTGQPPLIASNADANCDGDVNGLDAVTVLRSLGGAAAAGGGCTSSGDADCDGAVNAGDVNRILRIVAGIAEEC
jgi:hypothetical protein